MPPSLWAATARPAPEAFPLEDDADVEVAVIGGGYAGLSTALHLAERGVNVLVAEASEIGWGASGRSGGQVIPGIKYDPEDMRKMFGEKAGEQATRMFGATADTVFDLIERHGIECDAVRGGWAQPAHSEAALGKALDRCRQWKEAGADVDELSRDEMNVLLGTEVYHGGWIDRRGGSIQPLSYTRGLAEAASKAGARIASRTAVDRISKAEGRWHVRTSGGEKIVADKVVVCTNGYSSDLVPGLEKSIIAANSFQIATGPLSDNLDKQILKDGVVASDTRRLLAYWRRDAGGRFIIGGRGTFDEPKSEADFQHLDRMLKRIYPALADRPIEFRWGGRVALTQDFLPHLHEPEDGLIVPIGCQGRGVGLQTSMGKWIAEYLSSGDRSALPLPVTDLKAIPFHGMRRLYVSATIAYYKARDIL